MKKGYIYLITNKVNGKQYVGQTARDIWTRFEEHCQNTHGSAIGNAIQKYGYLNFSLQELEAVSLEQLDEREKYWIKYYNTYHEGYNKTLGGKVIREYEHLCVVERNLVIDSAEEFGRIAADQVGWSNRFLTMKIREVVEQGKDFLGYHFQKVPSDIPLSPEDEIRDWIQTLQIRFTGKHIYCFELEKEFDTIADCARFLLDSGLSTTTSKTPLQSLVTAIGKQLHETTEYINSTQGPLTFCFLPGSTKNQGCDEPFKNQEIYCPQLDMTFESQVKAAEYMLDNGLWAGIKKKTARLRISDVVNGNFPDYKGYTFERR
jgi:group I intron endonuclease